MHDERMWQNGSDENARISQTDVTKAVGGDVSPVRRTEKNVVPVAAGPPDAPSGSESVMAGEEPLLFSCLAVCHGLGNCDQ